MSLRKITLSVALLSLPLFGYVFWHFSNPDTLIIKLSEYQKAGEEIQKSFSTLPALPIKEEDTKYTIEDTLTEGIEIAYPNQEGVESNQETKPSLTINFPKEYASEPMEVQIAEGKSILIQDKNATGDYTSESLSLGNTPSVIDPDKKESFFQSLFNKQLDKEKSYLSYTDASKRITTYYAYGHDQATGEKQLKNWQVYNTPAIVKGESVAYSFTNAKLKKNDDGTISVYYYGDQELANEKAATEVDPSLMARAQRTIAKDMGDDIARGNTTPNFIIPKPYYINANGDKIDLEWRLSMDGKDISIDFSPDASEYPLALDPTLSFTAPAQSNTGDVITGDWGFGTAVASGDFNADGKVDLAVGLPWYGARVGRVYVFYNDGALPATADNADAIITGEGNYSRLGSSLTAGDFNADGKIDLAVGAHEYNNDYTGRAYIFYNDGSYPSGAASADVKITGETAGDRFEIVSQGDFNSDGKMDLIVGAIGYSSFAGRAYIFYNDGSYPSGAASADIIITGEASSYFGSAFTSADFNNDGETDISVGAYNYSSKAGRVYVFYNDGSFGTAACTTACLASNADVIITGEAGSGLGMAMTSGDFNTDGKADIAIGAPEYNPGGSGNTGKVYIFYNANIVTGSVTGADVLIQGGSGSHLFGDSIVAGDFNSDGKTDLSVMAIWIGRAYIFYNDGSYSSNANTADVIITIGSGMSAHYGVNLASGDFNADGRIDLAVGSFNTGRTYIFYSQNGQVNTNQSITGDASGDYFGQTIIAGDFNADGRIDLAVGVSSYSTNTGRVYIFYSDGSIPSLAASADVIITGEATSNYFGSAFTAGDFNNDGRTDLATGAYGYSTNNGRAYIFYNDGSIPTAAGSADVIIAGTSSNQLGKTFASGDLNADGTTDLISGNVGRNVYIFYNDGSYPASDASANVMIDDGGSLGNGFGTALATGDFNSDGRIDLAIGAPKYLEYAYAGRVYIFYNDGSIPTTSATADVTIESTGGSGYFGAAFTVGDFNSDGKTDLASSAYPYGSSYGRVFIFYNDGGYPATAGAADVIIDGATGSSYFGWSLASGDFNADGRTDLAVGDTRAGGSFNGRVFVFYNDGSYPATTTTADIVISDDTANDYFGFALTAGDLNADGRTDLIVGAYGYSTNTGRVYLYETRENFAWQLHVVSPATGGLRVGLSGTGEEFNVTGQTTNSDFGSAMISGDFNADGRADLVVGAKGYSSNTGRVYIFYNDGSLSPSAINADVIISGSGGGTFGDSIASGDFNADGRIDLAVNATTNDEGVANSGSIYIFYNDGVYPLSASTADVHIYGEAASNYFGTRILAGDFNADGRTDISVSSPQYSSNTGRVYIFYNGAITTENASGADVIITGEATNSAFGSSLAAGDFNADGRTDIAAGARTYNSNTGRGYIFYNDIGGIPGTAATADVIISGSGSMVLGDNMVSGDFNADGKTDIAIASPYSGGIRIFYADGTNNFGTATCTGSSPTTCLASDADVHITPESSTHIGAGAINSMTAGDFNTDGRIDLAVGARDYSTDTGRAYIFYNDGSIPTTAATADVILTGEATSSHFSSALTSGDFNADGKTDLVVGAYGYSSNKGRVYMYTWNDPVITGEATGDYFGAAFAAGDFNTDGEIDLAVGASRYSTNTGRVYIFYSDGSIPSLAASADVIITGEATGHYFGISLAAGDFNSDGKTDLVAGADEYKTAAPTLGRLYIFYNGAIVTENASGADTIITGTSVMPFAETVFAGDFNSDGRTDIISRGNFRAMYLFYNDGSYPSDTGSSDVRFTAEVNSDGFGSGFASGDFNADGKTDLAVGAETYSSTVGRMYIYYGDGVTNNFGTATCSGTPVTCLAVDADVIVSGESGNFGSALTAGDFNTDGKMDIATTARTFVYSSNTSGRAYIFYNGAITTESASGADVIITGTIVGGNYFGTSITSGDFNADSRTDLVVGNIRSSDTYNGKAYIFYNDGSYPSFSDNADVTLTGEATNNYFSKSFIASDFNADGKTDFIVGAYGYSTNTGRVYMFTTEAAVKSVPDPVRTRGTVKLRGTSKLR